MLDLLGRRGVRQRQDVIDHVSNFRRFELGRSRHGSARDAQRYSRIELIAVAPAFEDSPCKVPGPDGQPGFFFLFLNAVSLARVSVTGGTALDVECAAAGLGILVLLGQVRGHNDSGAGIHPVLERSGQFLGLDLLIELGGLLFQPIDDAIVHKRLDHVDERPAFFLGEMAERKHGRAGQSASQHAIQIVIGGNGIAGGHQPEPPVTKVPRFWIEEPGSQPISVSLITMASRAVLAVPGWSIDSQSRRRGLARFWWRFDCCLRPCPISLYSGREGGCGSPDFFRRSGRAILGNDWRPRPGGLARETHSLPPRPVPRQNQKRPAPERLGTARQEFAVPPPPESSRIAT